jgi:hypothetical protein
VIGQWLTMDDTGSSCTGLPELRTALVDHMRDFHNPPYEVGPSQALLVMRRPLTPNDLVLHTRH